NAANSNSVDLLSSNWKKNSSSNSVVESDLLSTSSSNLVSSKTEHSCRGLPGQEYADGGYEDCSRQQMLNWLRNGRKISVPSEARNRTALKDLLTVHDASASREHSVRCEMGMGWIVKGEKRRNCANGQNA